MLIKPNHYIKILNMNSESSNPIDSFKDYQLYGDSKNPQTLVVLKNIENMAYLHRLATSDDGRSLKIFPNYYILNNIAVAHKQKAVLYAMTQQQTSSTIMTTQFCKLARMYYENSQKKIQQFSDTFSKQSAQKFVEILKWYSEETFFYRLLNRLLRGGRDCTELYHAQYFAKLLSEAIKFVHKKQKKEQEKEVCDGFQTYRGAQFTQQQITQLKSSIEKNIETLGFLSTSIDKQKAEEFIGNALVCINVSNLPKDEELDVGYAFLTSEFSKKYDEREVLFNMLSSFQIKSVKLVGNFWLIELQYGVTYQMVKKQKASQLNQKQGTVENQRILAILSWQKRLTKFTNQCNCLLQQNAVDQFIWLLKTKISLYKNNPQLQKFAFSQQLRLYEKLVTDERFKGKEQKFRQQRAQIVKSSINQPQPTKKPLLNILHKINIMLISINQSFKDNNFKQVQLLVQNWKQQKYKLFSNNTYQRLSIENPQIAKNVQQWQINVLILQAVSNLKIYDANGEAQKIRQQITAAQKLQQRILQKYDRHNYYYARLRKWCIYYSCKYKLISYEEYLKFQQQKLIVTDGAQVDENSAFQSKLLKVKKQANSYISVGSWVEAVRTCAEFRNEYFLGREGEDIKCFEPVIIQLNKQKYNPGKLKILHACLSVNHPKSSTFYRQTYSFWKQAVQNLQQNEKFYVKSILKILKDDPIILLSKLQMIELNLKQLFFEESIVWITHSCLIVNNLRMLGMYEEAKGYFHKLKLRILTGKNPEYYGMLSLHQFEAE